MKITAGEFRGRVLKAPKGLVTRPTASRLREALFNMAQEKVEGAHFLDLFAGSGIIGFEALSRGAASITFIEQDPKALKIIQENSALLHVEESVKLLGGDVFRWIKKLPKESFSMIFADPPYGKGLGERIAKEAGELLLPGGWLLIEEGAFFPAPAHLKLIDQRSYGSAFLTRFLKP